MPQQKDLDRGLIQLIHKVAGTKKTYNWFDLYRCLDKMVELSTEPESPETV